MAAYRGKFLDNFVDSQQAEEIRQFLVNSEPMIEITTESLIFPKNINVPFSKFIFDFFTTGNQSDSKKTTIQSALGEISIINSNSIQNCI